MINKETGCIYQITNKVNGKSYIGQTIDFNRRMWQHKHNTEKQVINKAINKYGIDNFEFKIIHEDIPIEDLNDWEIYYINEIYNTFKGRGYNIHIGGQVYRGKHSNSALNIPTKRINNLVGYFLDNDVNFLQLEELFEIHRELVSKILKGEHYLSEKIDYEKYARNSILDKHFKVSNNVGIFSGNSIDLRKAQEVVRLRKKGFSLARISEKINLGENVVGSIVQGNHWTNDYIDFEEINLTYIEHLNNYKEFTNAYNLNFANVLRVLKLRIKGLSGKTIHKYVDLGHNGISKIISKDSEPHPMVDIMSEFINYPLFLSFSQDLTYSKAVGVTLYDVILTIKLLKKRESISSIQEDLNKSWQFVNCVRGEKHALVKYLDSEGGLKPQVKNMIKSICNLSKEYIIGVLD